MSGECEDCGNHTLECDCLCDDHKWISVKDRLPEVDVEILFFCGTRIRFGEYVWYGLNEGDYRWRDAVFGDYLIDITHWMPLPEPPKDK